jgi:PKD repeat protein
MKKTTLSLLSFAVIAVLAVAMFSCAEDPADPPTVTVSAIVDGYQVAFTATATNADTYSWDFGDGETSTELSPTHTYALSGSYNVFITVTGDGGDASASTTVTIEASEMEMLTGGTAYPNGKAWKVSTTISPGDGVYYCTVPPEFDQPITDGVLGFIGLPTEYDDQFIFHHDLSYTHAVVNDSAIANMIYCTFNGIEFRPSAMPPIALAPWAPVASTFTYTEDTDLIVTCVDPDDDEVTSDVTWENATVLEIAGTEFFGVLDYTRKYMVLEISVDKLRVGIFASTSEGSNLTVPKHLLIMTYVPAE